MTEGGNGHSNCLPSSDGHCRSMLMLSLVTGSFHNPTKLTVK